MKEVCARGIEEGEILLTIGRISSVADYQIEDKLYGGVNFVGYPTLEGSGTALGLMGEELAINARSGHQELAWDFVKYYMQNGYWGRASRCSKAYLTRQCRKPCGTIL